MDLAKPSLGLQVELCRYRLLLAKNRIRSKVLGILQTIPLLVWFWFANKMFSRFLMLYPTITHLPIATCGMISLSYSSSDTSEFMSSSEPIKIGSSISSSVLELLNNSLHLLFSASFCFFIVFNILLFTVVFHHLFFYLFLFCQLPSASSGVIASAPFATDSFV